LLLIRVDNYPYHEWYKYTHKWNYSKGSGGLCTIGNPPFGIVYGTWEPQSRDFHLNITFVNGPLLLDSCKNGSLQAFEGAKELGGRQPERIGRDELCEMLVLAARARLDRERDAASGHSLQSFD
jgi:hypothetical protein